MTLSCGSLKTFLETFILISLLNINNNFKFIVRQVEKKAANLMLRIPVPFFVKTF